MGDAAAEGREQGVAEVVPGWGAGQGPMQQPEPGCVKEP
jgi:hypothetical protein